MLADHLTTCEFTPVPCSNKCKNEKGEIKHFMRKNLGTHLAEDCPNKDYECEHCWKRDTYANITKVHDEICEKKVVPCTNIECPKTMQRQKIANHVKDSCQYTVIACKRQSIGCDVELKRKDMAAHEQEDTLHLHLAMDTITALKEQCSLLKDQCSILKKGSITFRLTDYQKKKENDTTFYSPSFYTGANGYHMKIRVDANGIGSGEGTHLSVYACCLEGKYDAEVNWPFIGRVMITLLNQVQDDDHHTMTVNFASTNNIKAGTAKYALGYNKGISHSELQTDALPER